jgi:hypothetical protein
MKLVKIILTGLLLLNFACSPIPKEEQHLFYLHGRIIELQGIKAISPQFGPYAYLEIIDSLNNIADHVYAEVRTDTTNFYAFCTGVSQQIDRLISEGVTPTNITVVGASKGAVMAMQVSNDNPQPINYVLLAANNDYIEQENNWSLHGRILGIYETSDQLAGKDYQYWIDRSGEAVVFEQLQLQTGLGHGFLYQPLPEWLQPLRKWLQKD